MVVIGLNGSKMTAYGGEYSLEEIKDALSICLKELL